MPLTFSQLKKKKINRFFVLLCPGDMSQVTNTGPKQNIRKIKAPAGKKGLRHFPLAPRLNIPRSLSPILSFSLSPRLRDPSLFRRNSYSSFIDGYIYIFLFFKKKKMKEKSSGVCIPLLHIPVLK